MVISLRTITRDQNMVFDYLSNTELKDMEVKYNHTRGTIRRIIKSLDIPVRKYKLIKIKPDRLFFDEINTEEKAYWLGFITADGHVDKKGNYVDVELGIKDLDHLSKLGKIFGYIPRIRKRLNQDGESYRGMCVIRIGSVYLVTSLKGKGLSSNKTEHIASRLISYIPKNLLHHFIRGFFDGDGSISLSKPKNYKPRYEANFCGVEEFLSRDLQRKLLLSSSRTS